MPVFFDFDKSIVRPDQVERIESNAAFLKANPELMLRIEGNCVERGTNENTNGLIRRLHPKKSSFANIGVVELKRIDTFLNDRPRKCLGWSTPREKMAAFLGYTP